MIKYKLGDLAKDLNMQAKDIADMIKERFKTVKKPGTLLTDEELNYIFEKVTADKSVSSFEKYFASKQKAAAPKQEKTEKKELYFTNAECPVFAKRTIYSLTGH